MTEKVKFSNTIGQLINQQGKVTVISSSLFCMERLEALGAGGRRRFTTEMNAVCVYMCVCIGVCVYGEMLIESVPGDTAVRL